MNTSKSKTRYSISAVSRITGKGRSTIQRDMKAGKLSWVKGPNGAKLLDASEIARCYPDCDFSREEGSSKVPAGDDAVRERDELQLRIEAMDEERRREREQLREQIDHLRDALKLAQEGSNTTLRLLEDQRGGGGSGTTNDLIDRKLEDHEARVKDEMVDHLARARTDAERQTLDELKSLPWWSALRKLAFS